MSGTQYKIDGSKNLITRQDMEHVEDNNDEDNNDADISYDDDPSTADEITETKNDASSAFPTLNMTKIISQIANGHHNTCTIDELYSFRDFGIVAFYSLFTTLAE